MTSSETSPGLTEIEHDYFKCHSWIQGIAFSTVFEADFGLNCCKMDAVATHLSRWGTAMGFTNSSSSAPSAEECSEENIRKAKVCLSAINKYFSRAFEDGSETAAQEQTNILDSQIQMGKSGEAWNALHAALRKIQKTRAPRNTVPSTSIIRLYEKDSFDGLVRTASSQIRRLNALFPSLKAEQTSLSSDEISTVKDGKPGSILWLKEIVKSDDEFLNEALEQETSSKRNFYLDIKVQEEFKGQFGNKFAKGESSTTSSTYKGIVAGGKAEVHFGNTYGSTT
ncbi:hypothetical protein F5882DRAFT_401519 [Hyaloscypha sp. PMI_1271]|nr:hypothetical protein F5882DRAFT_401519 [Hyaloscypha sp. PMI_1271]